LNPNYFFREFNSMTSTSHLAMHREHAQWRADSDLWRDDVAIWEQEIDDAIHQLPEVEAALRRHGEMLRTHAASVRLYDQDPAKHEHLLADYERGQAPEALIELAQSHQRAAKQHEHLCENHTGFKNRQHRLMTKWRQLFVALAHTKVGVPQAPAK
jgi:hypothetical protein